MKRTTVFLTDELDRLLKETAERTGRSKAETIHAALTAYLTAECRPWPRSIGMGRSADTEVNSTNVKEWVRQR